MATSAEPPLPPPTRWRDRLRWQFSMRTLLIVITAVAIVLGLWTWIAWSLPIAMYFIVRGAWIVALVFLVQGALLGTGPTQHFCRGAAIGLALALFHSSYGGFTSERGGPLLWLVVMPVFCTSVGGWAGVRAHAWWTGR